MVGVVVFKYIPKMLFLFVGIVAPLIFIILILILTNSISLSYKGFAIDSQDNLYVGKDGGVIGVYSNGKLIKNISLMTSKGYAFTIKNDRLVVAALSSVYTLDLEGNILEKHDDLSIEYNKIFKEKNNFIDSDGNSYCLKEFLGYYSIRAEDDTKIFDMPVFDYVVKILLFLICISFIIFVPIIIYRWRLNVFQDSSSYPHQ